MPTAPRRRDDIAAAVDACNRTHPAAPLPRNAARLLVVMFSRDDVCRQSLEALEGEGFSRGLLPGMLRALIEAGLVSKQVGSARISNTYRLLLSAKADAA